jgi:hypothetical protein
MLLQSLVLASRGLVQVPASRSWCCVLGSHELIAPVSLMTMLQPMNPSLTMSSLLWPAQAGVDDR